MTIDIQLLNFLNNLTGRSQVFDAFVIFLASYLQYILVAIFILFLYVSDSAKQEKIRILFVAALSAVIARFGITELVRFLYHRPRPFLVYQLHPLITEHHWSFPSGHAAFFFALAAALYFYNRKLGVWFFIAAIFMNVSRVIAGVHYPSDILGGTIIGVLTAYTIFFFVEKREAQNGQAEI